MINEPNEPDPQGDDGAGAPFESELPQGPQRFLAYVIEHALSVGQRTANDFIRFFPPAAIMHGLRDQAALRANIMVIATGLRPKIALKKSAEACAEDLQIALEEAEADAETVVTLFDPDDRVRYLDPVKLWSFVTEGDFWKTSRTNDEAYGRAKKLVAYMIDRALVDGLLTHRDILEGISVHELAKLLPREAIGNVIAAALAAGRSAKPFVDRDLLAEVPPSILVEHVPLSVLWEGIVVPRIAEGHRFVVKVPKPGASASSKASGKDAGHSVPAKVKPKASAGQDDEVEVDVDLSEPDIVTSANGAKPPAPPAASK